MMFLEKLNFSEEEINKINENMPQVLKEQMEEQKRLVSTNILYLKELGVENYKEIYSRFYDMFLLDFSSFRDIFEKYEKKDLIEKLKKSINIVEYL